MRRYQELIARLESLVREGVLRVGDRAPSVRQLSRDQRVSPGTVTHAYELLQARGYLESRARSGYFVSDAWRSAAPEPQVSRPRRQAAAPAVSELVFQVLEATRARDLVPLGSAFPGPDLFPLKRLAKDLAYSATHLDPFRTLEDLPPGNETLRRQIAQRYRLWGAQVSHEEIVITSGALEALNLALQVLTRPNDIVLIESPAFYGCLQAIESLGLRALEVPTHPRLGILVDEVARLVERHDVRACWVMTSFQNPLGATLPERERARLVRLLGSRGIPLIEDNVYAELYLGRQRSGCAKIHDREGLVLDCGSFSKSLAPGYRIGWIAAGRFAPELWRRKIMTSLSSNIPAQAALARFLARGVYERHLAGVRRELLRRQRLFCRALTRHFPQGARWSAPDGGYLLWVELPAGVEAIELHQAALAAGISVAPGPIFSARRDFRHAIRLNYGHPFTPRVENALRTLGSLIARRARSGPAPRDGP
ncbi:MAG: PLP-dependent aminotransferase family protein [Proteobacteria bacterium]|nr:PLP-dependent aminotransferase family protein [Pseudomonadota bacterium]